MSAYESSTPVLYGYGHREWSGAGVAPASTDFPPGEPSNGDIIVNRNPANAGSVMQYRYASLTSLWEAHASHLAFGVTLTNAQILALNTTPVLVVPAMGANTLIEVVSVVLENVYATAAFASGGAIQLSYGSSLTYPASATIAATFLTSPAVNQIILAAGALASTAASNVQNTAIYITNATGNFTTGGGTINVRVTVRVHASLA